MLAFINQRLQHAPFGREPEAIIDQLRIARHQAVFQMRCFAVQRDAFHGAMRDIKDGAAWRFVAAAGLHADKAVFHQIQPANAVFLAEGVQAREQGSGRQAFAIDANRIAAFEFNGDIGRAVWRIHRADGALPDHFIRRVPGFFQDFAFAAAVQQIGINTEGRFATLILGDGDLVFFGEFDQARAAGQVPFAPGRDDLHIRLQRVIAEFKPHLVIALAGRAMRHRISAHGFGDFNLALGDQRARDGGAEQIHALIQRIGAEHGEDEIADEFFPEIINEDVLWLDAKQQRLVARRAQFLTLAKIGGEGDDFALIGGLQPFQDDAGIQPARIGEHDLLHIFDAHDLSLGKCRISGRYAPRPQPGQAGLAATAWLGENGFAFPGSIAWPAGRALSQRLQR